MEQTENIIRELQACIKALRDFANLTQELDRLLRSQIEHLEDFKNSLKAEKESKAGESARTLQAVTEAQKASWQNMARLLGLEDLKGVDPAYAVKMEISRLHRIENAWNFK
jgi:hypothetical protein